MLVVAKEFCVMLSAVIYKSHMCSEWAAIRYIEAVGCNNFSGSCWMAKKKNLSIEQRASVVTLSKENY